MSKVISLATGGPAPVINEEAIEMLERTIHRLRSGQTIGVAIAELYADGQGDVNWNVLDQGSMALPIMALFHRFSAVAVGDHLK